MILLLTHSDPVAYSFSDGVCVVRQNVFFTSRATSLQLGMLFNERRTGKS